ncbi:HAD hydrolase-like protein [Bifidobacterium leontopitheci]|uniref:Hydrolase n=1 Tax=Bifidobacterium leontopitheci TaxID=2650774 RepID=A0A6I1GGH8_9BIFI|nr:HAD hydrolase-like protein [Bifidobacterium leontopitheci]KAB7790754.1 hydrolase [Bifidobacterium leontopitheci]
MTEANGQGKRVVLLDLDGTLTQSDPGIIACAVKAFEELGLPVPDDAEMHRFIGPAIIESFKRNHMPDDLLDEGVRIYREYYADKPVFDDPNNPGQKVPGRFYNRVYDGIPEQLNRLRAEGYYLAVATCKPEYQAKPVCDHFHLTELVDGVYGASTDNSRIDKDQVIRYCFEQIGFDKSAGDKALMVGDRWTDVDGAIACGLDCLGCRWGYAEPGELEQHGAYRVIDHVDELTAAVDEYFAR